MRNRILLVTSPVLLLALTACRRDMQDQPRYKPLAASDFFADHRSARPHVEGTIARGHLQIDEARYTGKLGGEDVPEFPIPITRADIVRGQSRFNIYCSPCHGYTGDGNGMVVLRGFRQAASFYSSKLMNAPVGHFFDVISNGFGAMPSYASRIAPDDRWRVVAYVRALELSESASVSDVPPNLRQNLPVEPAPRDLGQDTTNPFQGTPPARSTPGGARQ